MAPRSKPKARLISPDPTKPVKMATGTSMLDLPDELLLQIISYIPGINMSDFQLPTLVNLSRTCRRMYNLVQENLYATFDSFFCEPYSFLRTVMGSPRVAESVHSFKISYGPQVHLDLPRLMNTMVDRRDIKAGFRNLAIPDWKVWASECNEFGVEQEILFASIIMFCPNITSLEVDDDELRYRVPRWLEIINLAINSNPSGNLHQFTQLKTISIKANALKLRHLTPLFRLPTLSDLTISGLTEPVRQKGPTSGSRILKWSKSIKSPSLKHLILEGCFLDSAILALILDSCQALTKAHYIHDYSRSERYSSRHWWHHSAAQWYHVNPKMWYDFDHDEDFVEAEEMESTGLRYATVVAALQRHSASLQDLCILNNRLGPYDTYWGGQEDFSAFDGLQQLRIEAAAICGPEDAPTELQNRLPPSLKRLHICVRSGLAAYGTFEALHDLARHVEEKLPALEKISIEYLDFGQLKSFKWEPLQIFYSLFGIQLTAPKMKKAKSRFFANAYSSNSSVSSDDDIPLHSDSDSEDD